ncbi:MAG: hypothetical protein NTZ05_10075 [Chloroflexi bacterium]|nr:hypothetical protein [Chloroflexota bacterium]
MTSPWPKHPEFAALQGAVLAAAARVLETAHPDHAERFRESRRRGLDWVRSLDAAGTLPAESPFGPWRRILTTFTEIEMARTQVRTALYLLYTVPTGDLQEAVGAPPGAWVVYHAQSALAWLATTADAMRRLVGMLYRTCVRPADLEWNVKSAAAVKPIAELIGWIEAMRQRLADDGWTARDLERERLWDGIVQFPVIAAADHVWRYAATFRKIWRRELEGLSRALLFTFERVSARIVAEVRWEALA